MSKSLKEAVKSKPYYCPPRTSMWIIICNAKHIDVSQNHTKSRSTFSRVFYCITWSSSVDRVCVDMQAQQLFCDFIHSINTCQTHTVCFFSLCVCMCEFEHSMISLHSPLSTYPHAFRNALFHTEGRISPQPGHGVTANLKYREVCQQFAVR